MRSRNVPEAKDKIQVIKYLDVADMTITGSGKVNVDCGQISIFLKTIGSGNTLQLTNIWRTVSGCGITWARIRHLKREMRSRSMIPGLRVCSVFGCLRKISRLGTNAPQVQ